MRLVTAALAVVAMCGSIGRETEAATEKLGAIVVSAHIVVCPAGDSMMVVVLRDLAGGPWYGGPVTVDFCGCPGFKFSGDASNCATLDTALCRVTMAPDPHGVVEVPLSGGGLCPGGSVRISAWYLSVDRGEPACFDQSGDQMVDSTDVALVTAKLGSHDPGADFDGNGTVTQADLDILRLHLGHAAYGFASGLRGARKEDQPVGQPGGRTSALKNR